MENDDFPRFLNRTLAQAVRMDAAGIGPHALSEHQRAQHKPDCDQEEPAQLDYM